jgi:pimeloyl-ACP methyl ester carboxylesterase
MDRKQRDHETDPSERPIRKGHVGLVVAGSVITGFVVAVATDLHILLDRGRVPGPLVLVGHSSGAEYVRIFAGRYPEQVAGMVLLDGQPADAFESLPSFPVFYGGFRRVSAPLPSLARLGVGRLLYHAGL